VAEDIRAPHYSYEDLRWRAEEFLAKYHPAGTIPIPIEEIVEFQLGMDIVPMQGPHTLIETDGFVTSDLREIYVDEFVYLSRPGCYRSTLAHEVGHVVLHADLFRPQRFQSVDEWKAFVNSIAEKEQSWLEYQAYAFAGLVLVPASPLRSAARECVEMVRSEGIELYENWDFAWSRIAAFLAKRLEVSTQVVEKRLQKDGLPNELRD